MKTRERLFAWLWLPALTLLWLGLAEWVRHEWGEGAAIAVISAPFISAGTALIGRVIYDFVREG